MRKLRFLAILRGFHHIFLHFTRQTEFETLFVAFLLKHQGKSDALKPHKYMEFHGC